MPSESSGPHRPRAAVASDAAPLAALVERAAALPYRQALAEWLDQALRQPGDEARALVVDDAAGPAGVIVFGLFAGAQGAGRLHFVAVAERHRGRGAGRALLAGALDVLRARGARFVIAEVPDDAAALGDYWAFLAETWFHEESRVDDLVRDGVAMAFLRRDL